MRDGTILRSNVFTPDQSGSYPTAILRPPHLVTIVPAMSSNDYRDGWTYEAERSTSRSPKTAR
ncbi:MAG: hypothetical protein WBP81_32390 [Solirubrobacteraceae bacterium]